MRYKRKNRLGIEEGRGNLLQERAFMNVGATGFEPVTSTVSG